MIILIIEAAPEVVDVPGRDRPRQGWLGARAAAIILRSSNSNDSNSSNNSSIMLVMS